MDNNMNNEIGSPEVIVPSVPADSGIVEDRTQRNAGNLEVSRRGGLEAVALSRKHGDWPYWSIWLR
jgi:hypothetical protein